MVHIWSRSIPRQITASQPLLLLKGLTDLGEVLETVEVGA